jgi:small subunit ribosomal protein S1
MSRAGRISFARYQVGGVSGSVMTKQALFRSFVESQGLTGLRRQQSWPVGARISVRIFAINPENQQFSLSGLAHQSAAPGETDPPEQHPRSATLDQPQRTPSDSSAERFACTDATARNASRR